MRSLGRLLLVFLVATIAITSVAFGSGFSIFEQGAKATAMAGAFAATADDPSAIFYNVAGIAQQRRFTILAGGTAINFSNQFVGDPNDPFSAGSTGNYRRHTFVPPNAYVVMPVGSNLTFGVGMFTPYGLRTNWADPWVGRFSARDSNIKMVDVNPALAFQTSDGRFAVGAGADYRRARIALNRNNGALNPFTQRFTDVANVYLSSDWKSAWGWNVGVLFKPSEKFRIGAAYRADMDIDFTGDATFTQIPSGYPQFDAVVKSQLPPNQRIATTLPTPAVAQIGIGTGVIPNWNIEADITHTTWSRFKTLSVNFPLTPQINLNRPQNWKDTYSYRLGANHPVTPDWDVRLGVLYDENPQPTAAVSPLLPDSDRRGVSFGLGYHGGPWIVDGSVFLLHFDRRNTFGQSTDLNGVYTTEANLLSLNLGYRF